MFVCDASFPFAAPATAVEPDDWLTSPPFSTATFGDRFTDTASADAVWSIELTADEPWPPP